MSINNYILQIEFVMGLPRMQCLQRGVALLGKYTVTWANENPNFTSLT